MNVLYPDIKTNNWQLSTAGVGVIAQGLADIRQCLDILLRTAKGSDPLRPEFGSDIFKQIGKPLNVAIPNVVKAIIEAAQIWEQRVTIKEVTYQIIDASNVKFLVTYQLVDEELIDLLIIYLNGGFVNYDPVDVGNLTLYALFPPNPSSKRYTISFTANGNVVHPLPPPAGFASVQAVHSWVLANWGGYGTWLLGADRITLQAISSINTGSLTMSLTDTRQFLAPVPNAAVGEDYALSFVPDGVVPSVLPPSSFATLAEMLIWVQTNWSEYGVWEVTGNPYGPGDFNIQDFDADDFDIGAPAEYLLALNSNTVVNCFFEINIV